MTEPGRAVSSTIADVAMHAKVATSTVSYVLSGKRSISPATRRRVEASIKALNFYPNAGARSLAGQRTDTLALAIPFRPELYVPIMMAIATSVATTARRDYGQDVLLLTSEEGAEGIHRVAISNRADGILLMDVAIDDERIAAVRQLNLPAVLIGMPSDASGIGWIDLDFAAAGDLCVEHLAKLGHREMAFIGEAETVYDRHSSFAERTLLGVRTAASRLSVRLASRSCAGTHEAASSLVRQIIEESPHTTALIVQNEPALPSVLNVLRSARRLVPEDISIVAICSDQDALRATPTLTSVAIPAEEMGAQAVSLLNALLRGEPAFDNILLPPTLTPRGSTASVPPDDGGQHRGALADVLGASVSKKATTASTGAPARKEGRQST